MKKIISLLLLVVLGITTGCSFDSLVKTAVNPLKTSQQSQETQQLAQETQQQSQQPTQTQTNTNSSSIDFNWVDLQTDVLSLQGLVTDGKPDGHFRVSINFPDLAKIKYIIMRYKEFNSHVQWAWDYTKNIPIVGSPLAVFQKDTLVLQGTDIGFECSGIVDLDLYIPELNNENGKDTFKFEEGQNISIQINYITKSGEQHQLNSITTVKM